MSIINIVKLLKGKINKKETIKKRGVEVGTNGIGFYNVHPLQLMFSVISIK